MVDFPVDRGTLTGALLWALDQMKTDSDLSLALKKLAMPSSRSGKMKRNCRLRAVPNLQPKRPLPCSVHGGVSRNPSNWLTDSKIRMRFHHVCRRKRSILVARASGTSSIG